MQFIVSPAKTFKAIAPEVLRPYEALHFDKETRKLVDHVKNYTEEGLGQWMKMSMALAKVNRERYQNFYDTSPKAYEALTLLDGEAYR
ncbi:MAG: peroxide stress protein YaaA, partial [Cellulosilyticaceae bacterium]